MSSPGDPTQPEDTGPFAGLGDGGVESRKPPKLPPAEVARRTIACVIFGIGLIVGVAGAIIQLAWGVQQAAQIGVFTAVLICVFAFAVWDGRIFPRKD